MSDPRVLSLDIETYGKHASLPDQTCFSPRRSLLVDSVPLSSLVIACAITLPKEDPRCPCQTNKPKPLSSPSLSPSSHDSPASTPPSSASPSPWNGSLLAQLKPGPTFRFRTDDRQNILKLVRWLTHADTLIGMNIGFDILYLRAFDPLLRAVLDGRHTLIDLSVVNYLHCESRPERSLKTLGPVLGTHIYRSEDLKRLKDWNQILDYNAQDTHNTLLAIARLASLIPDSTPKLSSFSIDFYSQTIWSCVWMTEAGVPFHRPSLVSLARSLANTIADAEVEASPHLQISGEGSKKSRDSFLNTLTSEVDRLSGYTAFTASPDTWEGKPPSSVLNHPLLQFTEKRREISFSDTNRSLLRSLLPPNHTLVRVLDVIQSHAKASKLLGSYCFPLLVHRTHKKNGVWDRSCILVPQPGVPLPYPTPDLLSSDESAATSPSLTSKAPPTSSKPTTDLPSPSSSVTDQPSGSPSPTSLLFKPSSTSASPTSPPSTPGSLDPDVWLSHPTWYVVPSDSTKDDSGTGGGTLQGRITCKNDKHQTDPPEIEECRRSRWVGGLLADMDLSQIELRVAALASGDSSLCGAYLRGEDLHSRRAPSLWSPSHLVEKYGGNLEYIDRWKDLYPGFKHFERDVSKHINFADLFRAGAETMQFTVLKMSGNQLPLSFFERVVSSRATDRPGLWAWQEERLHEAHTTGRVILPFTGQSRSFLGGQEFEDNEIVNFPIQTMAGNVLRAIQHLVWRAIKDRRDILMYLNVFDALKFDLRSPSLLPTLSEIIRSSVQEVATTGYWSQLCTYYGRTIPLEYSLDH